MKERTINELRIPVTTWNKQGVNRNEISMTQSDQAFLKIDETYPLFGVRVMDSADNQTLEQIKLIQQQADQKSTMHVVGQDSQTWIESHANFFRWIEIEEGVQLEEPIRLQFDLSKQNAVLNDRLVIVANKYSKATVIVEYINAAEVSHSGFTTVVTGEGADLHLVKVQDLSETSEHNDYVVGYGEENSKLQLDLFELGAHKPSQSLHYSLIGSASELQANVLYLTQNKQSLDISTRVDFIGTKSIGNVVAKGIMLGESKKILRDTINFVSGCKGASGREVEQVLMLSDKVKNLSVPILLCGEEDVEGEHAATSGKPEEKTMFYMMSRGLSEAEAKKLLALGAFATVLEAIGDENLKHHVEQKVEAAMKKGAQA